MLRPGGFFGFVDSIQAGDVPALDSLLGEFPRAYHEPFFRDYVAHPMEPLIREAGLVPFKLVKYEREWPRTRQDLFWYLKSPKKIARLFAAWFIPLNLANCLVYLCRPADGE